MSADMHPDIAKFILSEACLSYCKAKVLEDKTELGSLGLLAHGFYGVQTSEERADAMFDYLWGGPATVPTLPSLLEAQMKEAWERTFQAGKERT